MRKRGRPAPDWDGAGREMSPEGSASDLSRSSAVGRQGCWRWILPLRPHSVGQIVSRLTERMRFETLPDLQATSARSIASTLNKRPAAERLHPAEASVVGSDWGEISVADRTLYLAWHRPNFYFSREGQTAILELADSW